jgi:hypothetical protein
MQVSFGIASACEPVFYALIYGMLPRAQFRRFTGLMQAAALGGHMSAGLLGQLMVSNNVHMQTLFIMSAVSVAAASVLFAAILIHRIRTPPAVRKQQLRQQRSPQHSQCRRAENSTTTSEMETSTKDAYGEEEGEEEEGSFAILRGAPSSAAAGTNIELLDASAVPSDGTMSAAGPSKDSTDAKDTEEPPEVTEDEYEELSETWVEIIQQRGIKVTTHAHTRSYTHKSEL